MVARSMDLLRFRQKQGIRTHMHAKKHTLMDIMGGIELNSGQSCKIIANDRPVVAFYTSNFAFLTHVMTHHFCFVALTRAHKLGGKTPLEKRKKKSNRVSYLSSLVLFPLNNNPYRC